MTWDRAFSMVFHTMQTQDSLSIGTTAFQLISMYREIGHWSFKGDIYLKSPCQNPTGSFLGQISKSNPIQASQHENPQPSTSLGISKPWLKRCCCVHFPGEIEPFCKWFAETGLNSVCESWQSSSSQGGSLPYFNTETPLGKVIWEMQAWLNQMFFLGHSPSFLSNRGWVQAEKWIE